MQVVPSLFAGGGIEVSARRRESPLPGPFTGGVRILAAKSVWQCHAACAIAQILSVQVTNLCEMRLQSRYQGLRQQRGTIPLTLPRRTTICPASKSMSLTLSVTHSNRRSPEP